MPSPTSQHGGYLGMITHVQLSGSDYIYTVQCPRPRQLRLAIDRMVDVIDDVLNYKLDGSMIDR